MRWLEPCCGTGRFLRLLARRGVSCAGVDLSPEVVAFANERLKKPAQRAIAGDIRHLDRLRYPRDLAPPFDFAFIPHNSIRHLATPADLTAHLRSLAAVLSPRGAYAVGVELLPLSDPIAGEDVHSAKRGKAHVSAVFEYFEAPRARANGPRLERVVSFTTHTVGRKKGRSKIIESSYDLLCIDPAMWRRCVVNAGLIEAAVVDDERARDLPADRTAYAYRILTRPRPASGRIRA